MKTHTEYLTFNTKQHREYVHITPRIEAIVKASAVREGMVLVSAMHITAGVYVNDNESGLIEDIDQWLEHLAPSARTTAIIRPARTMATRISSPFWCTTKSSCRSPQASSIWAPGSGCSMPNSTAKGRRE